MGLKRRLTNGLDYEMGALGEWVEGFNNIGLEMIESEQVSNRPERLLKPDVSMGRKWKRILH